MRPVVRLAVSFIAISKPNTMIIDIKGPIYVIDRYCVRAFVEIVNTIVNSDNADELTKKLKTLNYCPQYRSLDGYFKWDNVRNSFMLIQRIEYDSDSCFDDMVLTASY